MDEKVTEKKEAMPGEQEAPTKVLKNIRKVKRVMRKDDRKSNRPKKEELEFDKRIINIRRVTRVYKGGKRMRLSVFLAVGDKKGRVGLGLGKGADVRTAEQKAYNAGVKNLKMVNIKGRTIPHSIEKKYKASKIMLKPAAPGTGIIAGAAARSVLELAGVKDILSKRMGTSNNISVARATMKALEELRLNRI